MSETIGNRQVGIRRPNGTRQNYDCNKCASSSSIGSFNNLTYDNCEYAQDLHQSTSPLMYQMSRYKYENCSACTFDGNYYAPFDLVDYESELLNITRPASLCSSQKYSPTCKRSDRCVSTFDRSVPAVAIKDVCPVVCNNIKKMKTPGYTLNQQGVCGRNTNVNMNNRNSELRMGEQ